MRTLVSTLKPECFHVIIESIVIALAEMDIAKEVLCKQFEAN